MRINDYHCKESSRRQKAAQFSIACSNMTYANLRAIRRPHLMQLVWLDQLTSECDTSARWVCVSAEGKGQPPRVSFATISPCYEILISKMVIWDNKPVKRRNRSYGSRTWRIKNLIRDARVHR